jgi:hypothetical protein
MDLPHLHYFVATAEKGSSAVAAGSQREKLPQTVKRIVRHDGRAAVGEQATETTWMPIFPARSRSYRPATGEGYDLAVEEVAFRSGKEQDGLR